MADQHPAVGAWTVTVQIPGVSERLTNLAHLASDGGVTVAFPSPTPAPPDAGHALEYWTTAIGAWEATATHGARLRFVSLGVDEHGVAIGTHTITATITVDETGANWQGPFQIAITGAGGQELGTVQGTVTALRMTAK